MHGQLLWMIETKFLDVCVKFQTQLCHDVSTQLCQYICRLSADPPNPRFTQAASQNPRRKFIIKPWGTWSSHVACTALLWHCPWQSSNPLDYI
jgi:hypothetical protein